MIHLVPSPLYFIILIVAGWLNRELQLAVDYLRTENEILREQLPPPRRWLTDAHRRRLAVPAKRLGRAKLAKLGSLCKPETILAWYRRLVAAKYDLSKPRGVGRPPVKPQVVALILEMAKTTPIHGGHRIAGELKKLGYRVSHVTVLKYLREQGVEPEPRRRDSWATFLRAHMGHICAADFFNVEVLTWQGLVRYQVLFVIDLETRIVSLGGIVQQSHGIWCANIFRELCNDFDGFLRHKTHLILDNDPVFTKEARDVLRHAGVEPVKLPPFSPNLNAFAERFIGSIRRELLSRVVPLGEAHLRWLVREYFEHYNTARPHQGVGNIPPAQNKAANEAPIASIACRKRAGGLLVSWHLEAA